MVRPRTECVSVVVRTLDRVVIIDYAMPGPFTTLDEVPFAVLESVPDDPVGVCWSVHGLVIQPSDARG